MNLKPPRTENPGIRTRKPNTEDASQVWKLVGSCEPLDENSVYCNLLQCDHFADTCVVAECTATGDIVGWVSAYVMPDDPQILFVWQVAVHESARGLGVGKKMLRHLLDRDELSDVRQLKTTITATNKASWALFSHLARTRGGALSDEPHYKRDRHFDGEHATEHMVTIRFPGRVEIAA